MQKRGLQTEMAYETVRPLGRQLPLLGKQPCLAMTVVVLLLSDLLDGMGLLVRLEHQESDWMASLGQ